MAKPKFPFFSTFRSILKHPLLLANERLVAIAILYERDNHTGHCAPKIKKIMERTSLSPRSIARAIRGLKDKEVLIVTKTQKGNYYRFKENKK